MIKNIGSKIKILGEIYSLIIAILSGMAGVALSEAFDNYWFLLIVIIGPVCSLPLCWLLYGYGELIDNTTKMNVNIEIQKKYNGLILEELRKINGSVQKIEMLDEWVCDECGNKNDNQAKFCYECGNKKHQ